MGVTYDLLIVVFQTSDDQIHVLIEVTHGLICSCSFQITVGECRRLEIEGLISMVDDLEQRFIIRLCCQLGNLVLEILTLIIRSWVKFILSAHNDGLVIRPHCFLREVSTLVVEEAVTVAGPSYSFHQDPKGRYWLAINYSEMTKLCATITVIKELTNGS